LGPSVAITEGASAGATVIVWRTGFRSSGRLFANVVGQVCALPASLALADSLQPKSPPLLRPGRHDVAAVLATAEGLSAAYTPNGVPGQYGEIG